MMLTIKEATIFLKNHRVICSERTVRRWLQQGAMQGRRYSGDEWKINLFELVMFRGSFDSKIMTAEQKLRHLRMRFTIFAA